MDLKNEIRDMMRKGQTDEQIVDFMVARYGDFRALQAAGQEHDLAAVVRTGIAADSRCRNAVLQAAENARRSRQRPPELSDEQREQAYSLLNNADTGDAK